MSDPVLDTAPEAVFTTDEHGHVIDLNATAERILGFRRPEALGRLLADMVVHDPGASDAVLPDGGPGPLGQPTARRARRADGTEIAVELTVSRTSTTPPRYAAWMRALNEREDESAAAERQRALLEAAEEIAHVGCWEWIPDQSELVWSDNLFRIFGLALGSEVPSPEYVFEQTHPDDRDRVAREVTMLRERGELRALEFRIVRPDRRLRHLSATLTVAEWHAGRPYRLIGSVQDVTDRRWAEREIAAHVAVAQALDAWDSLQQGGTLLLAGLGEAMEFVAGVLWVPREDVLVPAVLWQAPTVRLPESER